MSFAANAVTDLSAPLFAPPTAPARDNEGLRFQDHLDAAAASSSPQSDDTTPARPAAKSEKADAARNDSAAPVENTQGVDQVATANANGDEHTDPTQPEKPAHVLLVQVAPKNASPPTTPAQQSVTSKQPAPVQQTVTTLAKAEQHGSDASMLTHVVEAQKPTNPGATPTSASSHKPGKGDGKTAKANAPGPAGLQPDAQAPVAPTSQVTTPAQPAATIATTGQSGAALGAVQAEAPHPAPANPAPAQATPRAAANDPNVPATEASNGDHPKADAVRAGKALGAAMGAKAAAPTVNPPGFKDPAHAAASSERSAPGGAASPAASATATQTLTPTDATTSDLAAARAAAPVAAQVSREIVRRANGGSTRFEIRLDPAELGKIQVRLDVSRDHKVTAVVTADNPQALSELSRGARDLQQSLQAAGLDLADDGLTFDLSNSGNGFSQSDQSNTGSDAPASARGQSASNESSADTSTARARPLSIDSWRGSRIDVMA